MWAVSSLFVRLYPGYVKCLSFQYLGQLRKTERGWSGISTYPYHRPVAGTDDKSTSEYERAYNEHCPLCRAEASPQTCPACGKVLEGLLFLGVQPDGYVCPMCQIHYDDLRPRARIIGE